MKMIDIFCGTGTFSIIAEELGWEMVYAIDRCRWANEIYNANHKKK